MHETARHYVNRGILQLNLLVLRTHAIIFMVIVGVTRTVTQHKKAHERRDRMFDFEL